MSRKFAYVGRVPQDLEGGRVLAPGDPCKLSVDEQKLPHNARLIEEGLLVPIGSGRTAKPTTTGEE